MARQRREGPSATYRSVEQAEVDRQADKSNHGKKAGDYADKTYYRAEDGKVVTTPPKGAGRSSSPPAT